MVDIDLNKLSVNELDVVVSIMKRQQNVVPEIEAMQKAARIPAVMSVKPAKCQTQHKQRQEQRYTAWTEAMLSEVYNGYAGGMTYNAIADKLGMSHSSVQNVLNRMRGNRAAPEIIKRFMVNRTPPSRHEGEQ